MDDPESEEKNSVINFGKKKDDFFIYLDEPRGFVIEENWKMNSSDLTQQERGKAEKGDLRVYQSLLKRKAVKLYLGLTINEVNFKALSCIRYHILTKMQLLFHQFFSRERKK